MAWFPPGRNSVPPLLAKAVAAKIIGRLGVNVKPDFADPKLLELDMAAAADRYGVRPDVVPQRLRKTYEGRNGREQKSLQGNLAFSS